MSRLGTAFRSFAAALGSADAAARLAAAIDSPTEPSPPIADEPVRAATPTEPPPKPARSDAVTLLAALQREARLIDFLMEPIDQFDDAQVGAAVRDVHRGCRSVLDRMLPLGPAVDDAEGTTVAIDPAPVGRMQRIGGSGDRGTLVHPGWAVREVNVPDWTGDAAAADVVMPAEVEV